MSEDHTPEWKRLRNELLSNMRGLWDELAKLSDWIWHIEKKAEELERGLDELREQHAHLKEDMRASAEKPPRPKSWRNIGWIKPPKDDPS